ncbi:hypothetical protein [Streptomyces katrae]|uniref:hypothetical protein n=1 Tax=Streptomyces katrae TaxID=68223 RepID=UPI000B225D9F|nr:hypothetical protein [Streptomyces katrae]
MAALLPGPARHRGDPPGHPARRLLDAPHAAALVVIGLRNRDSRLGPRTGGRTRTPLHRSRTPVAVVPHD